MRGEWFSGFSGERAVVLAMAAVRALSVLAEVTGLVLIVRAATIDRAVRVNSALGLVGPLVFFGASLLGLSGLAGRLSPWRLLLVVFGVSLVFIGTAGRR